MLSLTPLSQKTGPHGRLTRSRIVLIAVSSISLFQVGQSLEAASFALYGDPNFSFGASAPNTALMASAIQARMNIPITVVTSLADGNTAVAPVLANSQAPPFYVFGPSANGVIKNLNLNEPILAGLTSGELQSAGFEVDF